ncbi:MAG: hypothetical protein PHR45_04450 [Muribaculaceae bacterium]|nr:hypothetical protein [Muribaculaceae bacterium]
MKSSFGKLGYMSFGILGYWKGFSVALFFFILPIILSHFVASTVLPLITFAVAFGIFFFMRKAKHIEGGDCYLLLFIVGRTMLGYSALFVISAFVISNGESLDLNVEQSGKSLHSYFFPILMLAPLLAINTFIIIMQKGNSAYCKFCRMRNGFPSERSIGGSIHSVEMKNLLTQVLFLGVIFTILGWGYFIFLYTSVSITQFDKLIFTGVPILLGVIHEIAISVRYLSIAMFRNKMVTDTLFRRGNSCLRYLLICGDKVFLKEIDTDTFDTPFITYIPFQKAISHFILEKKFVETFNNNIEEMRLMYHNIDKDNGCGVWHTLCFINSEQDIKGIEGSWFDTEKLETLFIKAKMVRPLKNEIYRINIVISTIKTYHENGRRRYDIKGYKPAFYVSDIRELKVDYTSPKWQYLAVHNEDHKFFRLKRIWYKYIEGILD